MRTAAAPLLLAAAVVLGQQPLAAATASEPAAKSKPRGRPPRRHAGGRRDDDEAEAKRLAAWAARAQKPNCGEHCSTVELIHMKTDESKRTLTQINRGRLGNHLFQWAAIISIAKESGSQVVLRSLKYKPEANAQMRGLASLVWEKEDYAQLETQPNLCHVWDTAPIVVDTGLQRLSMWSGWGAEKGSVHIPTNVVPEPGQNWAKLWADAIVNTTRTLPEGTRCDTWELDGFFQQQWFFMDHIDLVREAFWHQPSADKAAEALKWLMYNDAGTAVGIHIRLGDYKYTNRNMPINYYHDALDQVAKRNPGSDLSCVIFSDDIAEAMVLAEDLSECSSRVPVPPDIGEEYSFYMMGLMPNMIIADSSFSFWAARLAPHEPLVIAPGIYKDNANAQSAYDYLLQTPGWVIVNTTTDMIDKVVRTGSASAELGPASVDTAAASAATDSTTQPASADAADASAATDSTTQPASPDSLVALDSTTQPTSADAADASAAADSTTGLASGSAAANVVKLVASSKAKVYDDDSEYLPSVASWVQLGGRVFSDAAGPASELAY